MAPRATLSKPRPILTAATTLRRARRPAPIAARPITSDGALSVKVVTLRATVVKPLARASVAGRIASPTLRSASLPAWAISAHFCEEVSRRSARFLSRIPLALAAPFFRSS
ncbi:hypothetical protein D9M71_628190 [compost metagenome]